jgi:predicted hotdog family 3-hydroxylacyl-ACP dehydratase
VSFPPVHTLIPHAGGMCLLDRIVSSSDAEIVCVTGSHRSASNPLRRDGRLPALHLAEYGAQAMAIHGGLQTGNEVARRGMLAAIRDLKLQVLRLDDLPGDLTIHAKKLVANDEGRIYTFAASVDGRELGTGRVAVMFANR